MHLSRANYRGVEDREINLFRIMFSKWWKEDIISNLQKLDRFIVLNENAVKEWPELSNIQMIPFAIRTKGKK